MRSERMRRLVFMTISQIGIRYPSSPLSQTLDGLPDGAPRAGDRFPWLRLKFSPDGAAEDLYARLDDTRFNCSWSDKRRLRQIRPSSTA